MLVTHTPRSSFESTHHPNGFLALPAEIRVQIYEYALADVVCSPLHIRKYAGQRWMLRYKRTRVPGILLACKSISNDATDVLDRICRPKFIIDQPDHRTSIVPKESNTYGLRDLSATKPVLQRIRHVHLEVDIESPCRAEDHVLTIALLRWIKAVINSRSEAPQSVNVDFQSEHATTKPRSGHGLFEVVRDIRCQEGVSLRFVFCRFKNLPLQVEKCEVIPMPALRNYRGDGGAGSEVEQSEWSARMALEKACALRRAPSNSWMRNFLPKTGPY